MKSINRIALLIAFLVTLNSTYAFSQDDNCKMGAMPSILFPPGSSKLTKKAITLLESTALQLKNNPGCNLKVVGYSGVNKRSQQLSWEHVNAIINYFVEQLGISNNRLIFNYGETGESEAMVDLISTAEPGPSRVPAPHPQLRKVQ